MYTDQDRVEAYLQRELTENEITILDEVILANSSYIESYTNRNWLPLGTENEEDIEDFEAENRNFDGRGSREIFVDDFSVLESVTILDSQGNVIIKFENASEWVLYPLNKIPKQSIHLRNYHYPIGSGNVEVKAVWGAGIVPADVVVVCTALTGKYLQKAGSTTGMYSSESIEGYSYKLFSSGEIDADTTNLLAKLDKWKKFIL